MAKKVSAVRTMNEARASVADADHHRETFLANAGTILLSSPLSVRETVDRVTQLVVPSIADWCLVDLPEEDIVSIAHADPRIHADPAMGDDAHETQRSYAAPPNSRRGLAHVLATGEAELYTTVTDSLIVELAHDPAQLDELRKLEVCSAMIVPLVAHGCTIGAIAFVATPAHPPYNSADLEMARRLAQKAALAIENARLFRRELDARLASERATSRMSRLQALAADLEQAMTSDAVAQVVINHSAAGVGAKTAAIWTIDSSRTHASMLRCMNYPPELAERFRIIDLASDAPVAVAVRTRQPLFIESIQDYGQRFPDSAQRVREDLADHADIAAIACLPLVVGGDALGVIAVAFALREERTLDADERVFLTVGAGHCALGLNRARTYEAEQRARREMALLYELVDAASRATTLETVYELALNALEVSFDVTRSSILLCDANGVMRFKAWHGLSDAYRVAVDGHSPWSGTKHGQQTPLPITVPNVQSDASLAALLAVLHAENISAMAFFPLVHQGRLLGMLMVYSEAPRAFTDAEVALSRSVATQIAQALARRVADSEIEALYREAKAAREEAEEANRLKDEFLAVVSHELRTPLAAILGWAHILGSERRDDPETLRKGLEVIERNARAQTKIIEDILDVSRIITGKLVLEPRAVRLSSVIHDALDAVRAPATGKEITLEVVGESEHISVFGDAERMRQILWNLLSNAIKFSPRAARVTVRIELRTHTVSIAVTDTGKGIERSFLPHVFERFRQADSSTRRTHGGLGLGLAIVRHLVELHGGHVEASSDGLGKGSTFTVELPLSVRGAARPDHALRERTDGEPRQATADSASVSLAGVRVLLVEDDADTREMLCEALKAFGATIYPAANVRQALEILRTQSPQVLVSDIGMPEEDGYALIARVRELPAASRPAVAIALTAYARPQDRRRALNAGYGDHLSKPTKPETLASRIASMFARASAK